MAVSNWLWAGVLIWDWQDELVHQWSLVTGGLCVPLWFSMVTGTFMEVGVNCPCIASAGIEGSFGLAPVKGS